MATATAIEPLPPAPPTRSDRTLDVISKSVATCAILVYGCGFLITSIYHASYGFLESDPLRPRIVFAGVWFIIFLGTPVFFVGRFLKEDHWRRQESWWVKLRTFSSDFTNIVLFAAIFFFQRFFEFDSASAATVPPVKWWLLTIEVIAVCVAAIVVIAVAAYLAKRFIPQKWLSNIGTIYPIGFLLWLLWSGYHQLYDKGRFDSLAVVFWFLAVGVASCLQAHIFRRRISPGDVPLLGVSLLAAVTSFATLYYPHIKSSWGGGMPIKATIYFAKDSPLMPSQSAYVSLIDESSLGFYVVGPNDKQATFIPRSSVAYIYFSGGSSGFFVPRNQQPVKPSS